MRIKPTHWLCRHAVVKDKTHSSGGMDALDATHWSHANWHLQTNNAQLCGVLLEHHSSSVCGDVAGYSGCPERRQMKDCQNIPSGAHAQ